MQNIPALSDALLDRMGIPDVSQTADYLRNVNNAVEEACAYLCGVAGNPDLDFTDPDIRSLAIDCSWYFLEHMRPEFTREYSGELINLRLTEGFGCGKA